jgi:hypothetical protein
LRGGWAAVDFVSLFAGLKVVGLAKAADSTKTAARSASGTSGWFLERAAGSSINPP